MVLLKFRYPFNGNASDESGNGNDGESQGAVLTSDRNGALKASSSASFGSIWYYQDS